MNRTCRSLHVDTDFLASSGVTAALSQVVIRSATFCRRLKPCHTTRRHRRNPARRTWAYRRQRRQEKVLRWQTIRDRHLGEHVLAPSYPTRRRERCWRKAARWLSSGSEQCSNVIRDYMLPGYLLAYFT